MKPTYRKGVDAFIIDDNQNFLLVQKLGYDKHQWGFAGGGIDNGETPNEALLRELREELNTDNFTVLAESPFLIKFDWPKEVMERIHQNKGVRYVGQEKHQFLVKYSGNKDSIKPDENELKQIKWVPYEDLESHLVFEGQWEMVQKVIEDFKTKGFIA